MATPLVACGKPYFFEVSSAPDVAIRPPEPRRGIAIRLWVRSLSEMQKEALVASTDGDGTVWRLSSDEGPYLNGSDLAPCPLSFLTTGMVSSYMEETLALARQRGIVLRDLSLVQDNFYTMEGSALKGTMTGGALPVVGGESQKRRLGCRASGADGRRDRGLSIEWVDAPHIQELVYAHAQRARDPGRRGLAPGELEARQKRRLGCRAS